MKRLSRPLLLLVTVLFADAKSQAFGEDWIGLRTPGYWEKQFGGPVQEHDGHAWYRCFVKIPGDWSGQDLRLQLGRIDDVDETFFNGSRVGGMGRSDPYQSASGQSRDYRVPANQVRFGEGNLIAVRVYDGGGAGGISAGPLAVTCSKGEINLAGQWQLRLGDDAGWAQWPEHSGSRAARERVNRFLAQAGNRFGQPVDRSPLAGTEALTLTGDLASHLVTGVDRFLLAEIDGAAARRPRAWRRDYGSHADYAASVEPNRQHLAHIIGVRDARVGDTIPRLVATMDQPALVGRGNGFEAFAVRWPVFHHVHGEGLLLVPKGRAILANIIAVPDAEQSPEQISGLAAGVPPESQYARRLAQSGCRVLVPTVINRQSNLYERHPGWRKTRLTHREFLYRSAFELGRHLIGYEVQKVLAGVDWFVADTPDLKMGVIGWGEGGLLALYAGAVDPRIDAVCVSGYFGDRKNIWQEPIDRNVFGLLEEFADAELASLILPRSLIIEAARGPESVIPTGTGGAPARLVTPTLEEVRKEAIRANILAGGLQPHRIIDLIASDGGKGPYGKPETLQTLVTALQPGARLAPVGVAPRSLRSDFDPDSRMLAQMREMDDTNQWLLRESPYVRRQFMNKLKFDSEANYQQSVEWYRRFFYDEVVGRFDRELLPPGVRSRKVFEEETWTGYEVVMDVFPDVIAYGILLVPHSIREGERRPVVVCQHGLEGRPRNVIVGDQRAYHDYAAKLAEMGFITFAPQNLYIFRDRFRTLQRKGNCIKKTLFSVITPQHQQIVNWLKTLAFVDPERIAFYGLSYGGKSAMRIPPLVTDYCLSICSADFNEWVWKNSSTRSRYSYVWTGEYEIFEFDLGSTFNYAEMAALICPRPFMVERGHHDGVAPDETVGYEFAKVRNIYAARGLNLGDRCEIEWFNGPHTINGKGTFEFLRKHLRW